jgi:hypothetical protein
MCFFAPLAALAAACSMPPAPVEAEGEVVDEGDPTVPGPKKEKGGTTTTPKPTTPAACPYDGPPLDVSSFAVCGDGGRCVPEKAIPAENAEQTARLAKCTGGFCVPEKILKAQGLALPKSCRSIASLEGRCTSMVFPDIEKQKDQLPQDACDANERCAPCFDPLGKETGACRSVVCDAPKEPGKAFPTCCNSGGTSKGRCFPSASLPAEAASGLEKKECTAAADLCIPEEEIAEKFVHPRCSASALLGSYDGVCISNCVKKDFLTGLGTAKGNCSADSFCAPCKNPLTGAATGAPDCGP